MAGRTPLEEGGSDLLELREKLGPEVAEVRRLVWTDGGAPGPLGKMVLAYRTLQTRDRLSATEMAAGLWAVLPPLERESFECDRATFIARIKRWFQPSQKPFASLTGRQADALAAAAAKVVAQLPAEVHDRSGAASRPPRQKAFTLASTSSLTNGAPPLHLVQGTSVPTTRTHDYIDNLFLGTTLLLGQAHEDVASYIYSSYLKEERKLPELLCVVGSAYSGKKSILAHVIQRYQHEDHDLPIFALLCESIPYTEVSERLVDFLGGIRSVPFTNNDERLNHIREYADKVPAIYVLADLAVLPSNPAYRLITQQDDMLELISILLSSHNRTRVIVSCEEPLSDNPDTKYTPEDLPSYSIVPWTPSGSWPISRFRLIRLAPPRMHVLLNSLPDNSISSLLRYQDDVVDGVTLHLAAAFLHLHAYRQTLAEGIQQMDALLRSARDRASNLRSELVAAKLWALLTPLQQVLCAIIAASDDGLRESSLLWVLGKLSITWTDEEREVALQSLDDAFNGTLVQDFPRRMKRSYAEDDLPGVKRVEETHYQFDRLTRLALLTHLEEGSEDEQDLVRRVHRLIATKAREQAHHRRLTVPGVYGARISDLRRDIQTILSLVASVDPNDLERTTAAPLLSPIQVEREVLAGRAPGRTVLRFVYLQIWRQDVDRDYRLSTEHAAEELRFDVLIAIATSVGKTVVPRRRHEIADYQVTEKDLDTLKPAFSGDEFLEFLTSLAMAAHQIGAVGVVDQVASYVEKCCTNPTERQVVLATKIKRAYIDTLLQLGREPDLRKIEEHVRKQIEMVSNLTQARQQAQLKLYLRLGEVCHLQGDEPAGNGRTKRDEAHDAFTRAVKLETELSGNEECGEGRPLISGYGARRFVRALLDWAMTEARAEHWAAVEQLVEEARDIHVVSLRRLTRHAADRAAVLLDEARLHRVEGYVEYHHLGRKEEAREIYVKARELVRAAQSLRLHSGMPIAVRLDLDGLFARICLQLSEVYQGYDKERETLLRDCNSSARRLLRVADRFRLPIHMVHSRVLRFRIRIAQNEFGNRLLSAYEDPELIEGLREALGICEETGLGLYRKELDTYLQGLPRDYRTSKAILKVVAPVWTSPKPLPMARIGPENRDLGHVTPA